MTGLIVNALNLMPIGSLDGGRVAMSAFGRKAGGVLGTVTLLLQAVSAIFNNYSLQLFWGLLVILFQRGQDVPAKVQSIRMRGCVRTQLRRFRGSVL